MRALIQRTTGARVEVEGTIIGAVGHGLLVLACAMQDDTDEDARWLAGKISRLRIFRDEAGRMNRSVGDVDGGALVVSQFTLAAETKGNRPGFSTAAVPEEGRRLYELMAAELANQGIPVETGAFGADMAVHLVNDGPVTIWLDSRAR